MPTGAERLDWIGGLPPSVREAVLAEMKPLKLPPKTHMFERGEPGKGIFRLMRGSAKVFFLASGGRELVAKVYYPTECIGDVTAVDGGPHEVFAETLTECEFLVLSHDSLSKLRALYPEINSALLNNLASILRATNAFLEEITVFKLAARVAGRLCWLAASAEARGEAISELKIPQKELGLMVGASRQAVNKVLADFQRIGVLKTSYGAVSIADIGRLNQLRDMGDNITFAD